MAPDGEGAGGLVAPDVNDGTPPLTFLQSKRIYVYIKRAIK